MSRTHALLIAVALAATACPEPEQACLRDSDCDQGSGERCLADDPELERRTCGVDQDGDGYRPGPMDCNDSDPMVHVGIHERCNAIDDDCDGQVDELGDSDVWFMDADGDGYGDPSGATPSCRPELGLAGVGGDCDDDDPDVNPVADELCNGADDDCDGWIDERAIDRQWLHIDQDHDGWGIEETELTCPGVGHVAAEGGPWDCDDRDDEMFPRSPLPDLGMDGRDVDCDGSDPCTDLDCDGIADLVFSASAPRGSADLWVVQSNGNPDLTAATPRKLPGTQGWDVNVGDLDRDGFIDLMAHTGSGEPTRVLWGSPAGPSADRITELPARGFAGNRPCLGDVDGEPGLELLLPAGAEGHIDIVPLRDDDYDVRNEIRLTLGYVAFGCDVADVNQDGSDDLLVRSSQPSDTSSRLYLGGPDGLDFSSFSSLPGGSHIGQPRFADLNEDGWLDIILPHLGSSRSATIVWNPGRHGSWDSAQSTDLVGGASVYATVGDVDGDGLPDVVLPEREAGSSGVIRVFRNDGAQFSTSVPQTLEAGRISHALLADLDDDGAPELLAAGYVDSAWSAVWWNDGTGTFRNPQSVQTGGRSVVVLDVDADGDLDPVFGGIASHSSASSRFTAFALLNQAGSLDLDKRWSLAPAAGVVRVVGDHPHPWNGGHR